MKLPSGKITKSPDRYVKEWRSLGKKLVKALGGERTVIGYDPGFLIHAKGCAHSEDYSVWLATRIVELFESSKRK